MTFFQVGLAAEGFTKLGSSFTTDSGYVAGRKTIGR